jgi:hypothetical protein
MFALLISFDNSRFVYLVYENQKQWGIQNQQKRTHLENMSFESMYTFPLLFIIKRFEQLLKIYHIHLHILVCILYTIRFRA